MCTTSGPRANTRLKGNASPARGPVPPGQQRFSQASPGHEAPSWQLLPARRGSGPLLAASVSLTFIRGREGWPGITSVFTEVITHASSRFFYISPELVPHQSVPHTVRSSVSNERVVLVPGVFSRNLPACARAGRRLEERRNAVLPRVALRGRRVCAGRRPRSHTGRARLTRLIGFKLFPKSQEFGALRNGILAGGGGLRPQTGQANSHPPPSEGSLLARLLACSFVPAATVSPQPLTRTRVPGTSCSGTVAEKVRGLEK